MSSRESFTRPEPASRPERTDFDPKEGLPPTERFTRCTICKQPNCKDPSHRSETAETETSLPSYAREIEPLIESVSRDYEYYLEKNFQPEHVALYEDGPDFQIEENAGVMETDIGEGVTRFEGREGQKLENGTYMPDGSLVFSTEEELLWQKNDGTNVGYRFPAEGERICSLHCVPERLEGDAANIHREEIVVETETEKGRTLLWTDLSSGMSKRIAIERETFHSPYVLQDGTIMVSIVDWGDVTCAQIRYDGSVSTFVSDGGILDFNSVAPDGTLFCNTFDRKKVVREREPGIRKKEVEIWETPASLGKERNLEYAVPYKDGFIAHSNGWLIVFDPQQENPIQLGFPDKNLLVLSCAKDGRILAKDQQTKTLIQFPPPFETKRAAETAIEPPVLRKF